MQQYKPDGRDCVEFFGDERSHPWAVQVGCKDMKFVLGFALWPLLGFLLRSHVFGIIMVSDVVRKVSNPPFKLTFTSNSQPTEILQSLKSAKPLSNLKLPSRCFQFRAVAFGGCISSHVRRRYSISMASIVHRPSPILVSAC